MAKIEDAMKQFSGNDNYDPFGAADEEEDEERTVNRADDFEQGEEATVDHSGLFV